MPRARPVSLACSSTRDDLGGATLSAMSTGRSLILPRIKLLVVQVMVGVVAMGLWQFPATVPISARIILPPFYFSTPAEVSSRVYNLFASGIIWQHLWVP